MCMKTRSGVSSIALTVVVYVFTHGTMVPASTLALAGQGITGLNQLKGMLESAAWSPDGKTLTLGFYDLNAVRFFEALTGRERGVINSKVARAKVVSFSPDGLTLAFGCLWFGSKEDENFLGPKLWDLQAKRERSALKGHDLDVVSLEFSPDGKLLASGDEDGTIKLWDTSTGVLLGSAQAHGPGRVCLAFSADGKRLSSGGNDRTARIWEVPTLKPVTTLQHEGHPLAIVFSADGKSLHCGFDGLRGAAIWTWDLATKEIRRTPLTGPYLISRMLFSPDRQILAVGTEDTGVKLWSVKSGKQFSTLRHSERYEVTCLAFSPDGKKLLSGAQYRIPVKDELSEVKVWDLTKLLEPKSGK